MLEQKRTESVEYFLVRMYNDEDEQKRTLATRMLWDKYTNLVRKMKFKLIKTVINHKMSMNEDIEEYESRAFDTFIKSLNNIDLNKCKHLKKEFKIYVNLWGYLMTMNRDLVKDYIENAKFSTPITSIVKSSGKGSNGGSDESQSASTNLDVEVSHSFKDIPDELEERDKRKVFWDAYEIFEGSLNKRQKALVSLKKEGQSIKYIKSRLGMSTKEVSEETSKMKTIFASIIRDEAKKSKVPTCYSDLRDVFSGEASIRSV